MSTPSHTDQAEPIAARRGGRGTAVAKALAAAAAVVALAVGANALTKGDSSSAAGAGAAQSAQTAPGRGAPTGTPPAMGTPVTGATLTKLQSAATAKYPGTVERAMKLADGSYVVHVIQSGGQEVHVLVSKDFQVTGTQQGGPPSTAPPAGQAAPSTGGSAAQS